MEIEKKNLKSTVLKLYHSGKTVAEIVTSTGASRSSIYYWIRKSGTESSSPINLRDYHFLKSKCERQEKMIRILKESPCTATAPLQDKLAAIEQLVSEEYNVHLLCETLNVAKGTYYNHIFRGKRGETKHKKRREELFPIVEQIYHENHQVYGAGKIAAIMKDRGIAVCENTVAEIMHSHNLFSIRRGAKALHYMNKARRENILKQNFTTSRPNEVWVSDVTYYSFDNKTYYLCVILDLFSRKVIAWKVSERNSTHLTKATFKMAYINREPKEALIFHSDNGSNYISKTFRQHLNGLGVTQSFSRPHIPFDNSVCESFFANIKQEELYRKEYRSKREFLKGINEYMYHYNEKRPHSILRCQTPNQFERDYYKRTSVQNN